MSLGFLVWRKNGIDETGVGLSETFPLIGKIEGWLQGLDLGDRVSYQDVWLGAYDSFHLELD